jgi:tetratricopeptide (TPR) repeat protein
MARRDAALPLPQQRSDIQANLMHADRFASQGHTAQAAGLYRTAALKAEAKHDFRVALTAYASAARLEGVGSDARTSVGRMQLQLGRAREAARTFEEAANESFQRGRVADGLAALRLAADAEPTVERWRRLLDWSVHLGHTEDAQRQLDETAAKLFADESFAAFIPLARLLLELRPEHVPTLRRLVRAHLQRCEVHRAVEAIQAILRQRPGDPDALEHMAEAFAALGRNEKAAEVIVRLAHMMLERGPEGRAEARRLVGRGLGWRPGNSDLLLLRRRLGGRRPPAPRRVTTRMPPLDLSEFVEAVPTRA